MAWGTGTLGTLSPGQIAGWTYSWGGQDKGAQVAFGNPFNPGGEIVSYDFSKGRDLDGKIFYSVTVKNVGAFATNYGLHGGGFV